MNSFSEFELSPSKIVALSRYADANDRNRRLQPVTVQKARRSEAGLLDY